MKKIIMICMLAGLAYQSKAQGGIRVSDYMNSAEGPNTATNTTNTFNTFNNGSTSEQMTSVPIGTSGATSYGVGASALLSVAPGTETGPEMAVVPVYPYKGVSVTEIDGNSNNEIPHRNIYMYGTNPKVNSYEQDMAILNARNRIPTEELVEEIKMRGTNPQTNSYEQDLMILNRYDKMRGKH